MSVVLQNIDFNMEILISDDGSNDAGFNIIERFCESYKKDNIFFKIYSQGKNIGEINNTKFLLENSNGEYVAYLDADDYWIDPNKLKKQIEFMDNNLDYSLCITGYYRIENDEYSNLNGWSCPTDINGLNSKSLTKYNIVGSSSSRFFRNYKNLVKDYFYEFPFSDWPLNFELSLKGKIWYLDYPSYIYRIHDNSLTSRTEIIVNEKRINILKSILDTNLKIDKIKKTYITHVTKDYLEVSLNLAKSIELFSKIPLIIYCINLEEKDKQKFNKYKNVQIRNINLDISEKNDDDYLLVESGNFYINRFSTRIYNILCCKTIAMEMALEEGWDEVCYLDSDCIATPLIDQLFDWIPIITNYPIATKGIHDYMILIENGVESGNPFANGAWPNANNKLCLEWALMNFLEVDENNRGTYRTTGIMLMNKNCLPFIKTWKELCFILPKLVNVKKYAPYHEETIYNVLSWKKTNKGFPLC